jgi:hypothetical protein
MLRVDGVVLDHRIEPQPEAVVLAVVERRLQGLLGTGPTAATAPAAPATWPGGIAAALLGFRLLLGLGLRLFVFLLGRLLIERGLRDLRLDLVAQLEVTRVLVLGRELVAAPELAQLGRGDVELVRDPGVGAALADPGADLIEL